MTKKTKKIIFFSILILVLAGASVGYYFYNKGPVNVKNASPSATFNAREIYELAITDSAATNKKFTDKIIAVSGVVSSIEINKENIVFIKLKTNRDGSLVNCKMEGQATAVKEQDSITLKGLYKQLGDAFPEMGILGDLYMERCYIIK